MQGNNKYPDSAGKVDAASIPPIIHFAELHDSRAGELRFLEDCSNVPNISYTEAEFIDLFTCQKLFDRVKPSVN